MINRRLYTLYPSTNKNKKYDVYVKNKKTGRIKKVSFGAKGYSDYTVHKDKVRRQKYRTRHKNDKIRNPLYAGFWSWYILWGKYTSIAKCMAYVRKAFALH